MTRIVAGLSIAAGATSRDPKCRGGLVKSKLARPGKGTSQRELALRLWNTASLTKYDLSGRRIDDDLLRPLIIEIEHVLDRASKLVERAISDLRQLPVLFDKANNGALVGHRVVHKVFLRVWGNDQERKPWPISATRLLSFQRARPIAASARSSESVSGAGRLIDDWRHDVIVPAVRV